MESINGLYLDLALPPAPPERPFVYINMVASVDGKTTLDGSERGLGSDSDKRLFHELRGHADAVLDGANTARVSGASPRIRDQDVVAWRRAHGKTRYPLGVLISASGLLRTDTSFFTSDDFDAAVFASEAMPADRLAALRATRRPVHVVPPGREAVARMLTILRREYGVERLLCEGGGTLNAEFVHLGSADELFLTIAPKIVGGSGSLTPVEGEAFHRDSTPPLELVSWHHFPPTGEVFTRWRFVHEQGNKE